MTQSRGAIAATCASLAPPPTELVRCHSASDALESTCSESDSSHEMPLAILMPKAQRPHHVARLKRHNTQESGCESDVTFESDPTSRPISPPFGANNTIKHAADAATTATSQATVVAGKLFVGGLAPEVTALNLREHFGRFGRVTDAVVVRHSTTRKSRGFGFVTFENQVSAAHLAQQAEQSCGPAHVINGRVVEVRSARQPNNHKSRIVRRDAIRGHTQCAVKSVEGLGARDDDDTAAAATATATAECVADNTRGRAVSCDDTDYIRTTSQACDEDHGGDVSLTISVDSDDAPEDSSASSSNETDTSTSTSTPTAAQEQQQRRPGLRVNRRYVSMPDPRVAAHAQAAEAAEALAAEVLAIAVDECESPLTPRGMRWRAMSESVLSPMVKKSSSSSDAAAKHCERLLSGEGGYSSSSSITATEDEEETNNNNNYGGRTSRCSSGTTATNVVSSNACKLFVGGLSPLVRSRDLRVFFTQFGVVKDAVVMFDRRTNRSRGFGFVTFATRAAAALAVCSSPATPEYTLLGKRIDVKVAESRATMASTTSSVSLSSDMHSWQSSTMMMMAPGTFDGLEKGGGVFWGCEEEGAGSNSGASTPSTRRRRNNNSRKAAAASRMHTQKHMMHGEQHQWPQQQWQRVGGPHATVNDHVNYQHQHYAAADAQSVVHGYESPTTPHHHCATTTAGAAAVAPAMQYMLVYPNGQTAYHGMVGSHVYHQPYAAAYYYPSVTSPFMHASAPASPGFASPNCYSFHPSHANANADAADRGAPVVDPVAGGEPASTISLTAESEEYCPRVDSPTTCMDHATLLTSFLESSPPPPPPPPQQHAE
jgi:RNA recognition motif-containing protein